MKVCRLLLVLIFSCSTLCSAGMMQAKSTSPGSCHSESKPSEKDTMKPCCDQTGLSSERLQLSHPLLIGLVAKAPETIRTSIETGILTLASSPQLILQAFPTTDLLRL